MELSGRVALVTGGATGIGAATVRALATAGARGVAINYRTRKDDAERLAAEARALGAEPLCVGADVADEAQVRAMVRQVGERFGRLDVLVNNAAYTEWVPVRELDQLTDAMWDRTFDVTLKGAFRCARAAAPLLRESRGMVVNVASVSGVLTPSTISSLAYGAAKAALIYLTRGLAVALAPAVRVNAVAPAFTDTGWMHGHFGAEYEGAAARASAAIPLGRVASPEDVAGAILGLVTGGDFVTGQTLLVDGGLSLG